MRGKTKRIKELKVKKFVASLDVNGPLDWHDVVQTHRNFSLRPTSFNSFL